MIMLSKLQSVRGTDGNTSKRKKQKGCEIRESECDSGKYSQKSILSLWKSIGVTTFLLSFCFTLFTIWYQLQETSSSSLSSRFVRAKRLMGCFTSKESDTETPGHYGIDIDDDHDNDVDSEHIQHNIVPNTQSGLRYTHFTPSVSVSANL